MAEPRGLFGGLISPTKIKGDASAIDEEQATMLSKLASGDISGSLTGGDKLIALGALLKSVSRGSKTSPQEVLQNLQQSKLQEMQTKVQLGQLQADAARKAKLKPIFEQAATGVAAGPQGQPLTPEDLYALSAQALALGDLEGAKALREQAAGIAQYTPAGALTTAFASTAGKSAFDLVKGLNPVTKQPFELPRWQAEGFANAAAWAKAQAPQGGGAAPAPGAPTGGAGSNVPSGSPLGPVPGMGVTGLSEGEKGNIEARTAAFKDLLTTSQASAFAAQQRLPQVQAMDALSQSLATGKLAEYKNAAQSWLVAFGLENNPAAQASVSNATAFTNLRKQVLAERLAAQKGPQTDRDAALLGSIGQQMTNTPAGNRLISAMETAVLRRDISFNNFLGRYKGDPGMALEAWSKTREGRLGVLGDPTFVKSAVATGAIKLGQGVDKRTNKKVYFVQTKNGQRIFLN